MNIFLHLIKVTIYNSSAPLNMKVTHKKFLSFQGTLFLISQLCFFTLYEERPAFLEICCDI